MKHILIGKDLLLNTDQIASALLTGNDKDGKPCIKVKLIDGVEWTIYANLEHSRGILKSVCQINEQFDLLENIKGCVLKNRVGRESSVAREIKDLIGV